MDFAMLPPEINSGRMYAGAGSGSLMAAAVAWDGLAGELQSAASSYGSVVSGLTNEWSGPSSASMAAAAAPYAAWMSTTAAQAEQASAQARAAAAAYEAAFAAMVPPPEIAANRAQLTSLVATNILGQNTVAIAATETQYGLMWAQDAAAMYGYAGSSAAATQVTPFTAPAQTTNPGGQASQAAAVAQATGTSAATNVQTTLSQLVSAIPQALQNLVSTTSSTASTLGSTGALPSLAASSTASSIYQSLFSISGSLNRATVPFNDALISTILGLVVFQKLFHPATAALGSLLPNLGAGLTSATGTLGAAGLGTTVSTVSAGMGSSGLVGGLSVPASWASATPAVRMLAASLPGTSLGAAPAVMAGESGSLLSSMGLASMAGGAIGRATPQVAFSSIKGSNKPVRVDHLVAELAKQPDNSAVQHWNTDSAGLEKLLAELAQKPGIHAVHLASDKQTKIASPKF